MTKATHASICIAWQLELSLHFVHIPPLKLAPSADTSMGSTPWKAVGPACVNTAEVCSLHECICGGNATMPSLSLHLYAWPASMHLNSRTSFIAFEGREANSSSWLRYRAIYAAGCLMHPFPVGRALRWYLLKLHVSARRYAFARLPL